MHILLAGTAAGGGFPQWNCRCPYCDLYWKGDARVSRRTQASIAVSANGSDWLLVNCTPDIREQILANPQLHPRTGGRDSPVRTVVLSSAEIDCVGGLLSLRERQPFEILAPPAVLDMLDRNSIFDALDPALVPHRPLNGAAVPLPGGLTIEAVPMPGKAPLHAPNARPDGLVIGVRISDRHGRSVCIVPSCAAVDAALLDAVNDVDLLLFDGTLWSDTELADAGVGVKSGRSMGHVPVGGPDGSLAALKSVRCGRKFYIHINNTNPLLCRGTPERAAVEAAGWTVPDDSTEVRL